MADQDSDVDTQRCSNCKKDIPSANFIMHQTHCHRNIILCKHCKEPVPRSEMNNHVDELHVQVTCKCGEIMEKRLLEDHEATACTNRQVECEFCELEMTFAELSDHQDFCGTRTEPCVKCSRYIMLKDQRQHEDTLCKYPETKPSPPKNVSRVGDFYPDEFSMDFGGSYGMYNPYADHSSGGTSGSIHNQLRTRPRETKPSNLRSSGHPPRPARSKPADPAVGSSPNNLKKTVPRKSAPLPRTRNKTHTSQTKNFSHSQTQSQRPKNQPGLPSSTHDEEADRMLAMHLAYDLTTFEDVDSFIESANQIPDPPTDLPFKSRLTSRGQAPMHLPDDDDDDLALPCEFCGDLFPTDILPMHQHACQEPANNSPPNNSVPITPTTRSQHFQPEIVDNLGYGYSPPRDTFAFDDEEEDTTEQIFLPCEFCEELLPEDSLVQHQAVCDSDRCKTPWPARNQDPSPLSSPDTVRTKPKVRKAPPPTSQVYGSPTRVTRRQQDPVFNFRQEERSSRQPGVPRKTNPLPSTNPYGSRQPMQSRAKPKNPIGPHHSTSKARLKSAERTRKTLDDLLADENVDTDEILEHMGQHNLYDREDKAQIGVGNGYWTRNHQDSVKPDEHQFPEEPALDEFDIFLKSRPQKAGGYPANLQSRKDPRNEEEDMPMGYEASFVPPRTKPAARPGRLNPQGRTTKPKSTNVYPSDDPRSPGGTSASRIASRSSHPSSKGAVPKSKKPSNHRRNGTDV